MLADGVQNTAANVIVQYVQISYGPWLENSEGGLEVQAALYPNASGVADVFRGGTEITGTWTRSTLGLTDEVPHVRRGTRFPCSPVRRGSSWCPTRSRRRRRRKGLAGHHGQQQAVLDGGEHAGMGARLLLVELAGGHALLHQIESFCFGHVETRRPPASTAAAPAPYSTL